MEVRATWPDGSSPIISDPDVIGQTRWRPGAGHPGMPSSTRPGLTGLDDVYDNFNPGLSAAICPAGLVPSAGLTAVAGPRPRA
jgi:hypothetical protein